MFPEESRNLNANIKLRNSLFLANGYNPSIPEELKKYFKDKIIDNSYLKKLCILLHSNDKNYEEKRANINKLTYAIDANNREYLTKIKFNSCSENSITSVNNKTIDENKNINSQTKINNSLNYFREPKVIINNEKLMMDVFKKKSKLIEKLPYLSRSTNDLINYNYKNKKDNKYILKNWMTSKNNYLNIIPTIKKVNLKKIYISPYKHYFTDKNNLNIKQSLSIKSINVKKKLSQKISNIIGSKTLDVKREDQKDLTNSINYENNKTTINKLKDEEDEKYTKKYNELKNLSNGKVIQKIENSIEIPGADFKKGMFPNFIKRKNESKIDFRFGNHFPFRNQSLSKLKS